MAVWKGSEIREKEAEEAAVLRRGLGLLLDGAVLHQLQVNPLAYRQLRSSILRDSLRLREPQTEGDLLRIVGSVVADFEEYRTATEKTLEGRRDEWRSVVRMLCLQLAVRERIDQQSPAWGKLMALLGVAASEEEIKLLNAKLVTLFRANDEAVAQRREREKSDAPDRSEANDNAAGLRGVGAAIEHVRKMMMAARPGYVAIFRLCCLDVVGERFGVEGIQDCLMAVSAFLIQNLRREDVVYHWSESSLLAVCDRGVREDILAAELNRLLAHNRDLHITIGDRTIMLRIPIELQLFPIARFNTADDLQSLPIDRSMVKARGMGAGMGLVRA